MKKSSVSKYFPRINILQPTKVINGGVICGVSEPATAYIHYTRVVCQWLLRGDLTLQWRECIDRPGMDVICTVAVGEQCFRVPNCIFGTNKIHPDRVFLLLLFDFLLLSEIVISFSASSE